MLKILKNDSIEVIDQGDSLREVEEKNLFEEGPDSVSARILLEKKLN